MCACEGIVLSPLPRPLRSPLIHWPVIEGRSWSSMTVLSQHSGQRNTTPIHPTHSRLTNKVSSELVWLDGHTGAMDLHTPRTDIILTSHI